MKKKHYEPTSKKHSVNGLVALLLVAMLASSNFAVFAQEPQPTQEAQDEKDTPKIPNDQLDSLVAPIALYPDPLLSQVLVASTYPLEIVQLQQWLHMKGQYMNEKSKAEAVQKEGWDPSIQAMVVLPEVVKQLAENIKWTSDLGNAFLAQQADVMDAVQRMRTKAKDAGKLKSNEQMKVETTEVESKTVVVIQQANPEVVYVPSYNPTVIWGTVGYYPYPPIYYPPYAGLIGFGVGVAIGAAWGGGGWGWGCGWGQNDININVNNNFVRHYNNTNINRGGNRVNNINSGNRTWQHNPQHRGGAPYANKSIANRYGGAARGDSIANRQATARQNISTMDRSSIGGGNRGSFGSGGGRPQTGTMDRSSIGGGNRASLGGGSGSLGGDRIGSRDISRGASTSNRGSFGGGGGSWGGGAARTSSSRGGASMGGGGFSRGGGGGFSRGGGGGGFRGGGRRR